MILDLIANDQYRFLYDDISVPHAVNLGCRYLVPPLLCSLSYFMITLSMLKQVQCNINIMHDINYYEHKYIFNDHCESYWMKVAS